MKITKSPGWCQAFQRRCPPLRGRHAVVSPPSQRLCKIRSKTGRSEASREHPDANVLVAAPHTLFVVGADAFGVRWNGGTRSVRVRRRREAAGRRRELSSDATRRVTALHEGAKMTRRPRRVSVHSSFVCLRALRDKRSLGIAVYEMGCGVTGAQEEVFSSAGFCGLYVQCRQLSHSLRRVLGFGADERRGVRDDFVEPDSIVGVTSPEIPVELSQARLEIVA
jgi:hypothetical protein